MFVHYFDEVTGRYAGTVSGNDLSGIALIPAGYVGLVYEDGSQPDTVHNMRDYCYIGGELIYSPLPPDSEVPPEPSVEERLTKAESENNKLRQQVSTNDDMLNGLTEYLSEKGLL